MGTTSSPPPSPSRSPSRLPTPTPEHVGPEAAQASQEDVRRGSIAGSTVGTAPGGEVGKDTAPQAVEEGLVKVEREVENGPWGWKWRTSYWFSTLVVAVSVGTDALAYLIVSPFLPFELAKRGYSNIAGLTGWLLFSYSAGILLAAFPVAVIFHRHKVRRGPLVAAVLLMQVCLIIFMVPKSYAALVVARFGQGVASCFVWTIGLALITENIPTSQSGRYLALVTTGMTVGSTIGPPLGGVLYKRLGWYAPFILCIILNVVDTVGRLLVIEPRFRYKWDASAEVPPEEEELVEHGPIRTIIELFTIPRSVVSLLGVFVLGAVLGAQDTTLALHVNGVWGHNAETVGLMFLAATVPQIILGPLMGWGADKWGSEWLFAPFFLFSIPWDALLTLRKSFASFIVIFGISGVAMCAINIGASMELAKASKLKPGVGATHQFSALNLAFSVSMAVGSVVGGQIFDHVPNGRGWDAICWIAVGMSTVLILPSLIWLGDVPVVKKLRARKEVAMSEERTLEQTPGSSLPVGDKVDEGQEQREQHQHGQEQHEQKGQDPVNASEVKA